MVKMDFMITSIKILDMWNIIDHLRKGVWREFLLIKWSNS